MTTADSTDYVKRVLSLGAGVQSTTVLLMALAGELPPLDLAVFADTGWEPAAVYDHLERLELEARRHGVPVQRVTAGNIFEDHVAPQGEHLFVRRPVKRPDYLGTLRVSIPLYTRNNVTGQAGKTQRRCTSTYKVEPVERAIRDALGLKHRQRWPVDRVHVQQVFGISWDETQRMRDSRRPCIANDYPLVDLRMTRSDCHAWLEQHGWTAPRSACIGCPFHRNDEWRNLRDNQPDEWGQAIAFDAAMREHQAAGRLSIDGTPFIHDQRVPLDIANLEIGADDQLELFGEECEGMCGL